MEMVGCIFLYMAYHWFSSHSLSLRVCCPPHNHLLPRPSESPGLKQSSFFLSLHLFIAPYPTILFSYPLSSGLMHAMNGVGNTLRVCESLRTRENPPLVLLCMSLLYIFFFLPAVRVLCGIRSFCPYSLSSSCNSLPTIHSSSLTILSFSLNPLFHSHPPSLPTHLAPSLPSPLPTF